MGLGQSLSFPRKGALPRRAVLREGFLCPGPGTHRQTLQELSSLGELVAVGTFTPADGPHQHHDGGKEALFQRLVLCRSGPRAQIRLRAQELVGESKKRGQGLHRQAQLGQGGRDVAGTIGLGDRGWGFL